MRSNPSVAGERLGVVGFSLGAYWSLGLSCTRPDDIRAVVVFYGTRTANYRKAKAAFLRHFAEDDEWAPAERVKQLEEKIRAAG